MNLKRAIAGVVFCAGSLFLLYDVSAQSRVTITDAEGIVTEYASLTLAFRNLDSGDTVRIYGRHEVIPDHGGGGLGGVLAPLQMVNKTNIVVQGAANAQIYGEGPGDFLGIDACKEIRIENITFAGNNPPAGRNLNGLFAMIVLRGMNSGITVSRCRFTNYGDHGISHLWDPKMSSHVLITECVFESGGSTDVPGLGADGSAVSGIGSNWTIEKCSVIDCVRGFEMENGGDNTIENIRILNNTLIGIKDLGVMLFVSNRDGNRFSGIDISGNTFKQFTDTAFSATAIRLAGGRDIRIRGNLVTDMANQGIAVTTDGKVSDVDISANIVRHVGNNGIALQRTNADFQNANIRDNIVSQCGEAGIRIIDAADATVAGNICYNNGLYTTAAGIELLGTMAQRALIRGNKCHDLQNPKTQDYGILIGAGVSAAMLHDNYCLNSEAAVFGIKDDGSQTDLTGNKTSTLVPPSNRTLLVTAVLVNSPPSASVSLQPDGSVLLTWQTTPQDSYAVDYKTSLSDRAWIRLNRRIVNNGPLTAAVSDNISQNSTRYYRIRVLEPAAIGEAGESNGN